MIRLWERIQNMLSLQKALEWTGGLTVMVVAGIFSPTYWLMTLVLKPYFDLRTLLSGSNIISSYIHLIHTMKTLGPQVVLLQIFPLLCLCLAAGILYSITCTWVGVKLTKRFINRTIPQAV